MPGIPGSLTLGQGIRTALWMTPYGQLYAHRGLVSRDLIAFLLKNDNIDTLDRQLRTFEIQMLKEDGSTEVAEDNGGCHAQCSVRIWDTMQSFKNTEGLTNGSGMTDHQRAVWNMSAPVSSKQDGGRA